LRRSAVVLAVASIAAGGVGAAVASAAGGPPPMPLAGGPLKPVVTGFPLATDALAANGGSLYVGGSSEKGAGFVYRVTP
jgi:hypothetical protein